MARMMHNNKTPDLRQQPSCLLHVSKQVFMQNHSCENVSHLQDHFHTNRTDISHEPILKEM